MADTQLPQSSVIPHLLRRMRPALLALIISYSITILGLVLIPGEAPDGSPYRLDFLHALYIASYTATTTGFGELPHAFTPAQRLWVTTTLYPVVIAWLYAIGVIIGLIRDPAFQQTLTRNRFRRSVQNLTEPFYLVCGYGETGRRVVREITGWDGRAVVLDREPDTISELAMTDHRSYVPAYRGDAALTTNLHAAGLTHPRCAGILAVTNDDHTNLHIAITAKLLNPRLKVIARAEHPETHGNMASFGTDFVVDPFETFAGGLALAIQRPNAHALYSWMSVRPEVRLTSGRQPPAGRWILCGYGRLGQAVHERLREIGVTVLVIAEADGECDPPSPYISGRGTEAETLHEAQINQASGLIAATEDDADNLSIVMTAQRLHPELFLAAQQNDGANRAIFEAAQLDMIMASSSIIALRMLRLVATPLLPIFLREIREHVDEAAIGDLLTRLRETAGGAAPRVWMLPVEPASAPALCDGLANGASITLETLLRRPDARNRALNAEVLMLKRGDQRLILPRYTTAVEPGDEILLAGARGMPRRLQRLVSVASAFVYTTTGEHQPHGSILRRLATWRAQKAIRSSSS